MKLINDYGLSATDFGAIPTNQDLFFEWLKRFSPALYSHAMKKSGLGVSIGTSIGNFFSSALNDIKQLAPIYLQTRAQKQILDVQVARAKQGLPPLQTSQLAPTVKVQASISPANMRTLTTQTGQSIVTGMSSLKMPLIIGGGLIAAMLFLRKR